MDAVSVLVFLSALGWSIAAYAWFIRGAQKYCEGYEKGWNNQIEICRLHGCAGADRQPGPTTGAVSNE